MSLTKEEDGKKEEVKGRRRREKNKKKELQNNINLEQGCSTYGQMWPAEAFNLAPKANKFVCLACFFVRNTH